MNNINFKGTFITCTDIKRANKNSSPVKVSAVRINPYDKRDLKALKEVHDLWDGQFSKKIYKDAIRVIKEELPPEDYKFFILTKQHTNFDNLVPDDILAEAQIVLNHPNQNSVYLDYMQVEPQNMYESEYRVYKGIGSAFLDFFKKMYKGKNIHLRSLISTQDFYKINGFRQKDIQSTDYYFLA